MRYKRAAGDNLDLGDRLVEKLGRAEAAHGGQDRQHDLCHEGVERLGRQQQHRCPGHEEGHPEVHDALASGSRTSTSTCLTPATRWPPTCPLTSPRTPWSLVTPSALSSSARSRCSPSAARRLRPSCACTRTSRRRLSPTSAPWRTSSRRPS